MQKSKKEFTINDIRVSVDNLERLDTRLKALAKEQKEAIEKFNTMLQSLQTKKK